MAKTDRFREQHNELLKIAGQIVPYLKESTLSKDASAVRDLLSKLMGTLKVHLSMEDKSLYPRLVSHPDKKVSKLAKDFIAEMGGIAKAVTAYAGKWNTEERIRAEAATFIAETKGLFDALGKRIERENNQLYPLLDAHG
ncbi:MAG: hemerythrin domain-containing protein [Nitrospirota bacterium]|nr:hemerythrin domain-containing protein [Nitrospirota bacterium]